MKVILELDTEKKILGYQKGFLCSISEAKKIYNTIPAAAGRLFGELSATFDLVGGADNYSPSCILSDEFKEAAYEAWARQHVY